jgi:hypothetical protein
VWSSVADENSVVGTVYLQDCRRSSTYHLRHPSRFGRLLPPRVVHLLQHVSEKIVALQCYIRRSDRVELIIP